MLSVGLRADSVGVDGAFRDIKDILGNVMTLWFFATPIIYCWFKRAPEKIRPFLNLNPFTHLAISYQEILLFPAGATCGPPDTGNGCWRSGVASTVAVSVRLFPVRPAARLVCGGS